MLVGYEDTKKAKSFVSHPHELMHCESIERIRCLELPLFWTSSGRLLSRRLVLPYTYDRSHLVV